MFCELFFNRICSRNEGDLTTGLVCGCELLDKPMAKLEQTITPTQVLTTPQQPSPAVNSPAFIEYVNLENNSQNIVFSGLLIDGLTQNPIANATINIVDSRNLTVYGQPTTNESGWFAFNFPLHDTNLSVKAVFLGDSQHQKYVSDIVNNIISSTPTQTPTVPELSWLAILPLFIATLFIAVKFRHRNPAIISK
jgi:hypothetical protein